MRLKQVFRIAKTLGNNVTNELLEQAMAEPYQEIQEEAVKFIIDNPDLKAESIVLRKFQMLPPEIIQIVIDNKFNFIPSVLAVIRSQQESERLSGYKFLAETNELEAINFLFEGVIDKSSEIAAFSLEAIDKVANDFLVKLRSAQKGIMEAKSYVEERLKMAYQIIDFAFRNYSMHRRAIFAEIAIEMYEITYDLIVHYLLTDKDSALSQSIYSYLSTANSIPAVGLIFKLYKEKLTDFTEFVERVLNVNSSPEFAKSMAEYICSIPEHERDLIAKSFKKILWAKLLKNNLDNLTVEDIISFVDFSSNTIAHMMEIHSLLLFIVRSELPENKQRARAYCLKLLSKLEYPEIIKLAEESLSDPSPEVVISAAEIIYQRLKSDSIGVLLPLMKHRDETVRRFIKNTLATTLFERYIQVFEELGEDVRKEAAKIIAKIDENIMEKAISDLDSLESDKRLKALKIIEYTDSIEEIRDRIYTLLKDPDRAVRATAIKIASLYATRPDVLHILIDALNSPDRRIRANTIEAFEATGDPRFISLLYPFLKDPDNRARANTAKALYQLGERERALDTLLSMLNDEENEMMRLSAVWALGEIGTPESRNALVQRLSVEKSNLVKGKILKILKEQ